MYHTENEFKDVSGGFDRQTRSTVSRDYIELPLRERPIVGQVLALVTKCTRCTVDNIYMIRHCIG